MVHTILSPTGAFLFLIDILWSGSLPLIDTSVGNGHSENSLLPEVIGVLLGSSYDEGREVAGKFPDYFNTPISYLLEQQCGMWYLKSLR